MRRESGATGRVFIVSAPSGAGKTTLVRALLRCVPRLVRSVSMTTRPPRPDERSGREYYFVTPAVFGAERRRGGLLEAARVHGCWYGTPKRPVTRTLQAGRDVVLSIDVQGAEHVVRHLPDSVRIFILPPSMASLRQRLERRRTEPPVQIRRRLALACEELRAAPRYDYWVVNDKLRHALKQLAAIVVAERCRPTRTAGQPVLLRARRGARRHSSATTHPA